MEKYEAKGRVQRMAIFSRETASVSAKSAEGHEPSVGRVVRLHALHSQRSCRFEQAGLSDRGSPGTPSAATPAENWVMSRWKVVQTRIHLHAFRNGITDIPDWGRNEVPAGWQATGAQPSLKHFI